MKTLMMAAVLGSGLVAQTAQQPSVSNSRFEVRPGSPALSSALQPTEATWFGYAIKTMRGDQDNCTPSQSPAEAASSLQVISRRLTT